MKFNYVIFQAPYEYYSITYSDLKDCKEVEFINKYPKYGGIITRLICKLHRSHKLYALHLPFKEIWNPLFYRNNFKDNKPICFLFSASVAGLERFGFIGYLKRSYPDAKFVCFYQDLVSSVDNSTIEQLRPIFDLIISYDVYEAKRYGIAFHNTVFSDYDVMDDESISKSDVYFIGAAKNRLNDILTIYHLLTSKKLSCDFNIIGVPPKKQEKLDGVHYIKHMSYEENLKHVVKTKVVLEVLQKKASGASLRMWECINYDKILLTNNDVISELGSYDSTKMHPISDISTIEKWITDDIHYDKEQKDSIRPIKLLEFIENRL